MTRVTIYLSPAQHHALTDLARREHRSLPSLLHEMIASQLARRRRAALASAARLLLPDYLFDPELTAFHSLNGEPFGAVPKSTPGSFRL